MFLSDFDYELPDELIARYPTPERSGSRLLGVAASFTDRKFSDFPECVRAGDLLVFNDTRVIRARLRGRKDTGGRVEILIERVTSGDTALGQVKASKTPKPGSTLVLDAGGRATVLGRVGDLFELHFTEPLDAYLEAHGEVPLPPYLNRPEESADGERYQTVYANPPGAVAAPTAGLHFDHELLAETLRRGAHHAFVTLHVGAGTFQPLREERVSANSLHAERVEVREEVCAAVRKARAAGGRVIAVGTTSVRALEAASTTGVLEPYVGETDIFIQPGYVFRSVDALLTNFHLPKSSLMMLVAAFGGHDRIMSAYRHAVKHRYRFFSYGDAMLVSAENP
ncbi:MAG: tRNA preQ1(34) S-adenosylmethionine ribosyltransferase-isomerase QueA [Woeseiaceae bacterium]